MAPDCPKQETPFGLDTDLKEEEEGICRLWEGGKFSRSSSNGNLREKLSAGQDHKG